MKISTNFLSVKKLIKKFSDEIKETQKPKKADVFQKIYEAFVNDIKYQTRRGVDKNGQKFQLKLSKEWISVRKRIVSLKHQAFSNSRNNLTISGKLLDSMTTDSSNEIIRIGFTGTHKGYTISPLTEWKVKRKGKRQTIARRKNPKEFKIGGNESNDSIATKLNKDRPFFGIREKMFERAKDMIVKDLLKRFRNIKK